MPKTYKIAAGIFGVLIAVALIVYFVWLRSPAEETAAAAVDVETPTPEPEPTKTLAEQLSARLSGVTLNTSDKIVGDLVSQLSANPKLAAWMANEDLVRRFVAAVDNVAAGTSPRQHVDFLRPSKPFQVISRRGGLYVDPASYHRYDLAAEVFASLDTDGVAALYRELQPLIEEAYREISPPGAVFEDRLVAAIDQLLAVRVPTGQIQLEERTVTTYKYADDALEALSGAQKHFLRMGPDNVAKVQAKLRQIRDALQASVPER